MDSLQFEYDKENFLKIGNLVLNGFVEKFVTNKDENTINITTNTNEIILETSRLSTPFFLYSKNKLINNFLNYKNSFIEVLSTKHGLETEISYSLKANFNPSILKLFFEHGSWCSLVNKNELDLALKVGFNGNRLIFNGNGKTIKEIECAIKNNCFLNLDSLFNLKHTIKVCQQLKNEFSQNLPAKLIIRVNQSIDASVHSYLSTSVKQCKFGLEINQLENIIEIIQNNKDLVSLSGFHTHLGSTIDSVSFYDKSVDNLTSLITNLKEKYNIETLELINFGGGLGINYKKYFNRTSETNLKESIDNIEYPKPYDLALTISKYADKLKGLKVIVEPGRSLVGDAAILVTSLIGIKRNQNRNFMVVDSSMCEIIRPCLYDAYHHIDYIKPIDRIVNKVEKLVVDVVGPVCESGDFLAKDRYIQVPSEDEEQNLTEPVYLAVMDVGAYCSSMSMNYNLHGKPCEIMVEELSDSSFKFYLTRKPDTLNDILNNFTDF